MRFAQFISHAVTQQICLIRIVSLESQLAPRVCKQRFPSATVNPMLAGEISSARSIIPTS
jgi:hypothetical protein